LKQHICENTVIVLDAGAVCYQVLWQADGRADRQAGERAGKMQIDSKIFKNSDTQLIALFNQETASIQQY